MPDSAMNRPEAKAAIDELTASFFACFSNRDGRHVDLSLLFTLFVDHGTIARCVDALPEVFTLPQFIAPRQTLLTDGTLREFAEVETAERTVITGHLAHRLSTYRKAGVRNGDAIAGRGVKHFQFVDTPDGWRILSMSWDDERDGFSLDEISIAP